MPKGSRAAEEPPVVRHRSGRLPQGAGSWPRPDPRLIPGLIPGLIDERNER